MTLTITSDTRAAKKIHLAVFTKATRAGFPAGPPFFTTRLVPNSTGEITYHIADLPQGQIAVSAFHDLNSNQALDTNARGMPTEPYGFTNNARPRFGPPDFAEAAIQIGETSGDETAIIHLR